ncbi:hypothetical protein EVAR_85588_1 [Eumeta japonica]|uniref:Uncharacterized protein n=1 Tax=Eumeta variegata TaxID=151549 RepID=A0A4C2A7J6_EUMVA|nr:hypothetical protein EVAR_85588_1 [Eumeta japonica]
MSCSSAEDALKIEERLKIRGLILKSRKSLRTQNKHIADGLDWSRERAKVCYRRRARNDLECHPVLEVTTELYKRLKAAYVYVGLQRRPVWDQSPLAQCSHCLGYGHSRRCKEASEKCAHCGGPRGTVSRRRLDSTPAQNWPRDCPRKKTLATYPCGLFSPTCSAASSLRLSCSLRLIGGELR